ELINLVNDFRNITTDNIILQDFRVDAPWEVNQDKDIKYPALFFETPQLINIVRGKRTYNFAFYVLDRCLEGSAGERYGIEEATDTTIPSSPSDIYSQSIVILDKMQQVAHSVINRYIEIHTVQ